jgi:hypothetical protein
MKQQTAVEWLENQLIEMGVPLLRDEKSLIQQAKEMEMRQHENTWIDSRIEIKGDGYNYIGKEKSLKNTTTKPMDNENNNLC